MILYFVEFVEVDSIKQDLFGATFIKGHKREHVMKKAMDVVKTHLEKEKKPSHVLGIPWEISLEGWLTIPEDKRGIFLNIDDLKELNVYEERAIN